MRFILVLRSTFELQQEPKRLILVLAIFELQFMFGNQCLYVNKSLNSICVLKTNESYEFGSHTHVVLNASIK